jgi:hypothetical protein
MAIEGIFVTYLDSDPKFTAARVDLDALILRIRNTAFYPLSLSNVQVTLKEMIHLFV